MAQITLMRALSRQKTIKAEIDDYFNIKENPSPLFLSVKKVDGEMVVGTTLNTKEFGIRAKSQLDKIENLIKLHRTLKRKISEANNTNIVTINGEEMTVTEAIFYKETIEYKAMLLNRFKMEYITCKNNSERAEKDIEENARNIAKQIAGTGVNADPNRVEQVLSELTLTFSKGLRLEFVDPLSIEDKIKSLEEELRSFREEIDYILNEVNSLKTIDIDM